MPRGKVIAIGCSCRGRKWHFEGRVLCFSHWHAAVDAHVAVVVAKRKMLGRMAA